MSFVINDIVKMEWEKSRWIQTKAGKNKRSAFILACKEYETAENGVVPVFFTANKAFLFMDDEGLWSFQDIKNFIKDNYDQSFPEAYNEYVEIADNLSDFIAEDELEKYGLMEFERDIAERSEDLKPFGEETEVQP